MKTYYNDPQEYRSRNEKLNPHNRDFSCIHCRYPVSASLIISRVQNRNHCPNCLWSRHLDLFETGDRLSACKSGMRPIGVTFKRARNRYAFTRGELMIVHRCVECGKISLNRIAADDDPGLILSLPEISNRLPADVLAQLARENIELVSAAAIGDVRCQLEGALCG